MNTTASIRKLAPGALALLSFFAIGSTTAHAQAAGAQKPNILVIMGDDIGWFNLGSYNSGIMLDATPNLDRLASEGMRLCQVERRRFGRI